MKFKLRSDKFFKISQTLIFISRANSLPGNSPKPTQSSSQLGKYTTKQKIFKANIIVAVKLISEYLNQLANYYSQSNFSNKQVNEIKNTNLDN